MTTPVTPPKSPVQGTGIDPVSKPTAAPQGTPGATHPVAVDPKVKGGADPSPTPNIHTPATKIGDNPSLHTLPNNPDPTNKVMGDKELESKGIKTSPLSTEIGISKGDLSPAKETPAPETSPPLRRVVSEAKNILVHGAVDPFAITVKVKVEEAVGGGSKFGLFSLHGKNNRGDVVGLGALEPFLGMYPNLWIIDEKNKVTNIVTTETKPTPNRFILYFDQPLPNTLLKGREYELHTSNPT